MSAKTKCAVCNKVDNIEYRIHWNQICDACIRDSKIELLIKEVSE
jgi:hypothetical protein